MAEEAIAPWYVHMSSSFDKNARLAIRRQYEIPREYGIIIPTPDDRPHRPPVNCVTFFRDQLIGGLRFPIPPFLIEISRYFDIPLQQFAPNAFRYLCGTYMLFRLRDIPPTPQNFFMFSYPKLSAPGVFLFQSRTKMVLFGDMPSSLKAWKSRFFFLKFPGPIPWSHAWKSFLPPLPDVREFHLLPTFPIYCEKLLGHRLSIPKWLKVELLYLFGLSPVKPDTHISLGNLLFLSFCL